MPTWLAPMSYRYQTMNDHAGWISVLLTKPQTLCSILLREETMRPICFVDIEIYSLTFILVVHLCLLAVPHSFSNVGRLH